MALTRFGYLLIFSIIAVAAATIVLIIWPFGGEDGGGGSATRPTATVVAEATAPAATATPEGLPSLTFEQVVNFATFGAVVDIRVRADAIIVNLRPDFDTSGLGTASRTFTTTLPPGANSVEAALEAAGVQVNGEGGVAVIRE